MAKFSERLRVVEKVRTEGIRARAHAARAWGPALVFERLWREQGVDELLRKLARGRRFEFDPERVAFALALQRKPVDAGKSADGAAPAPTPTFTIPPIPGFDAAGIPKIPGFDAGAFKPPAPPK